MSGDIASSGYLIGRERQTVLAELEEEAPGKWVTRVREWV